MGKINNKLQSLIFEALKVKDTNRVNALRNVKAAFQNYETAKDAKELTDVVEINIIQKMIKVLADDAETASNLGRDNAVAEAESQIAVLQTLIPKVASVEEVETWLNTNYSSIAKPMMGKVITAIKETFPGFDGKIAATLVKNRLVK